MANKPISIDDQPACCACGAVDRLQSHHVIRRSQGGTQGETMWFCDKHHRNLTENRWSVSLDDQGYRIVERATGIILSQVYFLPEGFDVGRFVENLGEFSRERLLEGLPALEIARDNILRLPPKALYQVFEDAYGYAKMGIFIQAWVVQSYLGRFVRGEMAGAVTTLSDHLDCDPRTIYNRLVIAQLPLKRVANLKTLPARALTEAGKAQNREAAMDILEERRAQGVGSLAIEAELKAIRKEGHYEPPVLQQCPTCGHWGDPAKFKGG